jgi:hypothetical protein
VSLRCRYLVTVLVVVDLVKQDPDAVEATGGDLVSMSFNFFFFFTDEEIN